MRRIATWVLGFALLPSSFGCGAAPAMPTPAVPAPATPAPATPVVAVPPRAPAVQASPDAARRLDGTPNAIPVSDGRALTIVVLGTSTAAGKNLDQARYGGAPGNLPWAKLYEMYLNESHPGSRVFNLARPKMTSFEGLPTGTETPPGYPAPDPQRNITAALAHAPDAVILAYQLARAAPTSQIIENLLAIREAAERVGVPVWVSTPIPRLADKPAGERAQIRELQQAIVQAFGTHAIDFTSVLADPSGAADSALLLGDHHHPNQNGHTLMLQAVKSAHILDALNTQVTP